MGYLRQRDFPLKRPRCKMAGWGTPVCRHGLWCGPEHPKSALWKPMDFPYLSVGHVVFSFSELWCGPVYNWIYAPSSDLRWPFHRYYSKTPGKMGTFELVRTIFFNFPLLALHGIYHYWTCFLIFSRGLQQNGLTGCTWWLYPWSPPSSSPGSPHF